MTQRMGDGTPAARLSGDLLARKGQAAPAGLGSTSPLALRTGPGGNSGRADGGGASRSSGGDGTPAGRPDARPDNPFAGRARVTLRLDEVRHLRLKVTAAHLQLSLQDILTTALDRYLDQVSPEILSNNCVCLAAARSPGQDDSKQ